MFIDTNNPPSLDSKQNLWLYNAIDCCVTQDVLAETKQQLDQLSSMIYKFELAQWAPALEMMIRGVRIDQTKRRALQQDLGLKRSKVLHILDLFAHAVWDRPLNHNSPKQLQEFFYSVMGLPEQHKIDKGVRRVSTDREALEKLYPYLYARPLVNCILALRDIDKKLSVLNMKLCPDGRFRCSYNPSGTETGRWSSSASAFRTGTNGQNITEELRSMFIADPGMKLGYADLEQAESRGVAYITGDEDYIQACESGDLHTTVAKMIWPRLSWPHDPKGDREVADQKFYRHFSYRDISKRAGHGSNYRGKPPHMAKILKVQRALIEEFQDGYFSAFPGIAAWHDTTASELQANGYLVTPLGRRRFFLGRRYDDATLREAIAYRPQSTIVDILNTALWRVWKANIVQVLGQVHDAIVFQYKEDLEDILLPQVLSLMRVKAPITARGVTRVLEIPVEVSVGWNWQKYDKLDNPYGIKKWKGPGSDTRSHPTGFALLDQLVR